MVLNEPQRSDDTDDSRFSADATSGEKCSHGCMIIHIDDKEPRGLNMKSLVDTAITAKRMMLLGIRTLKLFGRHHNGEHG